jgi:2-polyprenyl-3-methyl-5-hydroxy-6-metoxy-1,4-benzoquinol methylase
MSEATAIIDVHPDLETRARQSMGTSEAAIYRMVAGALTCRASGKVIVDMGCGGGDLWPFVCHQFAAYVGVDVVRYEDFPPGAEFIQANLDTGRVPLPDESADAVVAVETIEHLENPRALMREMVRVAKPGGSVCVTTPNQLSLLSLLTLVLKRRHSAFQNVHYPAHLTALLEIDLRRMAAECGLDDVATAYSGHGRLVLTAWHYPLVLARIFPQSLSDNVLLIGRKPRE